MPLLNYTTAVEALKTVGQIQGTLVAHGAKSIMMNYDNGVVVSLSFLVGTPFGQMPIRLPIDANAVLKVLKQQSAQGKVPRRYANYEQAVRIAWRIVKDWVEAQMAILETEMVRMEQIFLPYMVTKNDKTVYEVMVANRLLLSQRTENEGEQP